MRNGKTIKIWRDGLIPRFLSFKVQSPMRILEAKTRLGQLIEEGCGKWKSELVKEIFTAEEGNLICNIPISQSNLVDKHIWASSKKVQFTVKLAYHFELSRKRNGSGGSSYSSKATEGWKNLWRMNAPGVIKMFVWKSINNCLPTKWNLYKRRVIENPLCPICEKNEETVCQAL